MVSNTVASSAFLLYLSSLPIVFVRVGGRVGEKGVLLPLSSGVDPGYFTQSGKLILLAPAIYLDNSDPIIINTQHSHSQGINSGIVNVFQ